MNTNTGRDGNADMLVEIAGWVSGYQMGSSAEHCIKRIVEAMQREGYVAEGKRRIIK